MSQSAKTAIGGITAALSVVLMLPTVMGLWTYALPAFAGILVMFSVIELDKKWASGIFVAVSLLSLIILPNKEAAVFYLCFFGNYPIIKCLLESAKIPRVIEYIIKFAVFNAEVILATLVMVKVFGVPMADFLGIEGETAAWTQYAVPITLAISNVTFILFDKLLTMTVTIYLMKWQKKFRKMFPFK